jgi:uncharacterized protein (TIGR03435 family)
MRCAPVLLVLLSSVLLGVTLLHAQTPPKFEVASVKAPAPRGAGFLEVSMSGGPGASDPGQFHCSNTSLQDLLQRAYGVSPRDQRQRISGPGWMSTERFDIAAKVPAGATKEQFNLMLQNLLTERFQMVWHREEREIAGYALRVVKGGPKMKESKEDVQPADENGPPPEFKRDAEGFLILPPGEHMATTGGPNGVNRITARAASLDQLAATLGSLAGGPVVNETGLKGEYDFRLEFVIDRAAVGGRGGGTGPPLEPTGPAEPGATLFDVLQSTLGLKLEPKKVPGFTLVIDHVEKRPTAN